MNFNSDFHHSYLYVYSSNINGNQILILQLKICKLHNICAITKLNRKYEVLIST